MNCSISYPPRQSYFSFFGNLIESRLPAASSVLEIGAGPGLHPDLQKLGRRFDNLTGIDPCADVLENPFLNQAVHSAFEDWNPNGQTFDHAFSFNVLEHLPDPTKFVTKLSQVVKPGGWFWSLTPHANHPFARLSRLAEVAGLKSAYRGFMRTSDGYHGINDYASYYRLNNIRSIRRFMKPPRVVFDRAEFILMDAGWESYFPSPLRWLPKTFDKVIVRAFPSFRLIFVFGVRIAEQSKAA